MLEKRECKLIKKEQLKDNIFKFSVEAADMIKEAKPRTICGNTSK